MATVGGLSGLCSAAAAAVAVRSVAVLLLLLLADLYIYTFCRNTMTTIHSEALLWIQLIC